MTSPTPEQLFRAGLVQQQAGHFAAATRLFEQVLATQPQHWGAIQRLGVIAYDRGRYEEALDNLRRSIDIDPNQASSHGNLGLVLQALRRFDEAIAAYQQALALHPDDPNLHFNFANALLETNHTAEAIAAYRRALSMPPGRGPALSNVGRVWNNLGNAYTSLGDLANSITAYRQAIVIQPDDFALHSNLLMAFQYSHLSDAASIAVEHRRWGDLHAEPLAAVLPLGSETGSVYGNKVDPDRRLRIGYVSPDFRNHSVARFLLPLLRSQDPSQCELYGYSNTTFTDGVTEQFKAQLTAWRDISRLSDDAAADLIRSDQIDILVDLAGHTSNHRLLVFARKPAPVQATYLGYPGTTGLRAIDYRITDSLADPLGSADEHFSETLLRIDPCAWCFDPLIDVPPTGTIVAAGANIAFGSFNVLGKLNEPTLQNWSEILHAVPGSRLLLKAAGFKDRQTQERISTQFAQFGIGPHRLELRRRQSEAADHLGTYREVDVALDTFPYNGTTTTCEALWMGVPVITRSGDRHASRVGLSLLTQIGLTELVAGSAQEFVELAVALAGNRPRLASLHGSLRAQMEASPLMDGPAFARRMEAAYRQMWRTWCARAARAGVSGIEPAAASITDADPSSHRDIWVAQGLAALEAGDPATAEACLRNACDVDDSDVEALNFRGVALHQLGRHAEARAVLERAIPLDREWADLAYNLAEVLTALGESAAAAEQYDRCVRLDPEHPAAWRRLFQARATAGHAGAADAGVHAVLVCPADRDLALAAAQILGASHDDALALLPLIRREAEIKPRMLGPQVLLYKAAMVVGETMLAVTAADRAAAIAPQDCDVLLDRISVLGKSGLVGRAIEAAAAYLSEIPDDRCGHGRMAAILVGFKEFGAAALSGGPGLVLWSDGQVQLLLGDAFSTAGRTSEALNAYERAIELGVAPSALQRLQFSAILDSFARRGDAIDHLQLLLESEPNNIDCLGLLGTLLVRYGKAGEGRILLERALAINPNHTASLCGLGNLAVEQIDHERAWELFQQAIAAAPDDPNPCVAASLVMNAHPSLDADAVLGLHVEWARRLMARTPPPDRAWANEPAPDRRLRIGYASPDLRAHSIAYFVEPLLAACDRDAFELFVFDSSPRMDHISQHLRGLVDVWIRVVGASDDRVAELIREHRIDILVDLAGHTTHTRLRVFARHPAPVQVSYLGYPNTTGLSQIDYRLTDAVADPPGVSDRYHVERLTRLPGGFLCFRPPTSPLPVAPLPAGADGPITFVSFNAIHKVNGPVIDLWSRVLRAVDGSSLMMKSKGLDDPDTRAVLLARFARAGIDADRVRFTKRMADFRDHLQAYDGCDIALDTYPYNGTTTTCEALWMGVPVVTLAGDRHASRVGLSILTQLSLPELAATSADEFVRIAAALASDRPRLAALRASMREKMLASTLTDGKLHAQEIEKAYRTMWQTWCDSQQHRRVSRPTSDSGKLRLLVEGWRFIPHSYAVVNQWQCLELAGRPEVTLYHRDRPLFHPGWKLSRGLFSGAQESVLERLRTLPPGKSPDVVYRIAYRIDITPRADAQRTVVFGTVEMPGMEIELVHDGSLVDRFSCSPEVLLVTPSQWSRDGMVRAGADPGQVHVISHGVDVDTYRPLDVPARLQARNKLGFTRFTFLHVGAMTMNKGCDLLLRAFAQVCRRYDDVQLVIKGSDSLYKSRHMLDHVLTKLSTEEIELVRPRLRYFGGVLPMRDMACLYAAADAYVCPYRAEGFNLPALEAAACGLPVICTAGGPTDEFTTAAFALRIDARKVAAKLDGFEHDELQPDYDHLVGLMMKIVHDAGFRSQAASAGPSFVQSRFTWAHAIDRLLSLIGVTSFAAVAPLSTQREVPQRDDRAVANSRVFD